MGLSGWVGGLILDPDRTYPNAEDRMWLAVELSREGSRRGKGGPFGAAIFDRETNKLLAPGASPPV